MMSEWRTIETIPPRENVLVYKEGRRGSIDVAQFWPEEDGYSAHWWTAGGPNAGSDYEDYPDDRPTHWMPLPEPPK